MSQKKDYKLNFISLTSIVVSLVIGMGIFKTPAIVAAKSGSEMVFFSAWIIGGFITLIGALIYAEIGQRLPSMGGYYKVFSHCYHPLIAFVINILMLVSNAATLAVIALIGADYVSDFLFNKPSGTVFNLTIATISIASFYFVNLAGLRATSITQNIFTVIKLSLMILLIASLFNEATVMPHGYNNDEVLSSINHHPLILLIICLVPVSFTYAGYQQAINFGSEASGTVMRRGIVVGVLISFLIYMAINFTYYHKIGFNEMKNANAIGALLFEALFGKFGAKVFDFFMILSVLAYVNVTLLSNPRVMYAMSKDGVLPHIFQRQSRKGALHYSLAAYTFLTIIIAFFGKEIDDILNFVISLDCVAMIGSVATLFILRKQKIGENSVDGSSKKFTPFFCVLYIFSYLVILLAVIIDKPKAALTMVALLLFALMVYLIFYHKKNNANS